MRTALGLGLAVVLAVPLTADDKKDDAKPAFDAAKMVGTWEYKSGEKSGTKVEGESLKPKVKITKDTITVGEGDMLFEFKYTVDPKASPAVIDMEMTKSPFGAGMKAKGIVEFDGDDLKLCYTPDGDRPTKFSGEKANLFVLKKAK
jgi:uncharacterized protein (TIGR03067 family)